MTVEAMPPGVKTAASKNGYHPPEPTRYEYRDERGTLLFVGRGDNVYLRIGPDGTTERDFRRCRLVPYRLPELLASDPDEPVFVVAEGPNAEEAVDHLAAGGLTATCAPGKSDWLNSHWAEFLKDRRVGVIGLPDDFGREVADQIVGQAAKVASEVKVVEPAGYHRTSRFVDWASTWAADGAVDVLRGEYLLNSPRPLAPKGVGGDGSRLGFADLSDEDLGLVPLAGVTCRPIEWLWEHRLAKQSMALMAGDGGIGKSQVLLAIAAAVTRGSPWPDGKGHAPEGQVLILSAEDRADDTIKPRLMAMGADVSKVFVSTAKFVTRRPDKPPLINFASFSDHAYWNAILDRIPDCRLIIADPLPSYLGRGVNDSKNMEIRQVLEPFIEEVVVPHGLCLIGNTHLNKSVDAKTPMHRISGSIAYANLPRNVHFVVRDPDDPERRFFKQGKCNNSPDGLPALAFRIESRTVQTPEGDIETAVPVFESETVAVDLNEVVNGKGSKRGPDPVKTSKNAEWLYDFLATVGTWVDCRDVREAAGREKILGTFNETSKKWSNLTALYRAKDLVPKLPEPRDGMTVVEEDMKEQGRGIYPRKHWRLTPTEEVPPF